MLNLDYICMECAQKININSNKNLANNLKKALGILQEDGVYAMFLWLEENEESIRKGLTDLLNKSEIKKIFLADSSNFPDDFKQFCEKLREIAKDIDKLLFMKKLIERTLIYSLYHAKIGE